MGKWTRVSLYRPDGGTVQEFDDVEVTHYDKNIVEFTRRTENADGTVTVTDRTSNLPYIITESVTGSKDLL
jgi:hypothetical protein